MRNWQGVDAKRAGARWCGVCGRTARLEAAHLIGRSRDLKKGKTWLVSPDEVAFLCGFCHREYDAHRLDLYPHLDDVELAGAVRAAGSAGSALRRLSGPLWRRQDASSVRTLDERLAHLLTLS